MYPVNPRSLFAAVASLILFGCVSPSPPLNTDVTTAAGYLDSVAQHVERYGTATISTPLLVDGSNKAFEFGLTKNADSYFEDARTRVQGAEAVSEQSLLSIAASASVSVDPTQAAAFNAALEQYQRDIARVRQKNALIDSAAYQEYLGSLSSASKITDPHDRAQAIAIAERDYANALSAPSTDKPTPPTASGFAPASVDNTEPKQADVSGVFSSNTFLQPGALAHTLFPNESLSISNRSAIITAAGDTTVAGIFKAIGQPDKALGFSDKRAFFAVAMVAVTPGYKTRQGFAADLSVTADVALRPAPPAVALRVLERSDIDPELKVQVVYGMGLQVADLSVKARSQVKGVREARDSLVRNFSAWECAGEGKQGGAHLRADLQTIQSALAPSWKKPLDTPQQACEALAAIGRPQSQEQLVAPIPKDLQGGDLRLPVSLGLSKMEARECGSSGADCYRFDGRYSPAVAAVSPMTEAQVLDQAASSRNRKQFALSLAAALQNAGQKAQGNLFAEYAKQLESDVVTRTPQNLITGYSSGPTFGYQIGPALEALENPSGKNAKSAEVLQRQSFPVLLIFGVDDVNGGPKIYQTTCGADHHECVQVWQPYLRLRQQTRWVPTRRFWVPLWWKRESEETAVHYAAALQEIDRLCDPQRAASSPPAPARSGGDNAACAYMRTRAQNLARLVNEGSAEIELPTLNSRSARIAQISSMVPAHLSALKPKESRTLILLGKNLDIASNPILASAPPTAAAISLTSIGEGAASLTLTANQQISPPFSISLTSDDGNGLVSQIVAPVLLSEETTPPPTAIAAVAHE
jgi:hypothetical protein